MLLLRPNCTSSPGQDVWSAYVDLAVGVEDVLDSLTDPERIACWSPVSFEVEGLAHGRLRTGSMERVRGSIGGAKVAFDIEVSRADTERLELVARGPVSINVDYRFQEHHDGVGVEASVSVDRPRGLTGQMLRAAVGALLSAGALSGALRRLESSLSASLQPELLAA